MVRRSGPRTNFVGTGIRGLITPQISNGIPVPTVFRSSPLSRAARTLEITWTGIILPNETSPNHSHSSREVVIAEVRSYRRVLNPFVLTARSCRIVVNSMAYIPATSAIPSLGSRVTFHCISSKRSSPKRHATPLLQDSPHK